MHLLRKATLRTPENVQLDFTLAGIGNRALALGLDYMVLSLGLGLILTLLNWLVPSIVQFLDQWQLNSNGVLLWVAAIAMLVVFVLYVGYFAICEALWQGQTLGKRWVKIRVIQEDGRPVGLGQSGLRALLRPIDDFLSLGLCFIIFGTQEKRIGDWVAGTLVIQEEAGILAPIVLGAESESIATQLRTELNPDWIQPEELTVVVNFLQRRSVFSPKVRVQISHQLATQLEKRLELDFLPRNIPDEVFLEAIYRLSQEGRNPGLV